MSSRNIALSVLLLIPLCSACEQASPGEPLTPQYIVNGIIDADNTYDNVGAFIVKRLSDGQIFPICSGTLIAETVFLTAAHCTAAYLIELATFGFAAYVTFDSPIGYGALTNDPRVTLIAVSQVVTNPAYNQRQSDSGDIGVLILSHSARGLTPATLPTLGLLDQLAAKGKLKNAEFTAVGYGIQERITGGGTPIHLDLNPIPRMYAFSVFNSLGPGYLRLSQNAATGNGGTCFGDSGGPNFLSVDGVQVLAATTVAGDPNCRSTNVDYRLDTKSARTFLGPFVKLP